MFNVDIVEAYKKVNRNHAYCPSVNNDEDWYYLLNVMNEANGGKDEWDNFLMLLNKEYGGDIDALNRDWDRVMGDIAMSIQTNKSFWEKFVFISERQRETGNIFLKDTKIKKATPKMKIYGTFFSVDLSMAFSQAMIIEGVVDKEMDWYKMASRFTDKQMLINSKSFRHDCYNYSIGFMDGLCVYIDYLKSIYDSNDGIMGELKDRGAEPYMFFTDRIYLKIDSEDRFSDLCFKETECNGYKVHTSIISKEPAIYEGNDYGILTKDKTEKVYHISCDNENRNNLLHIFYKQEKGEPITDYDIALSKL